MLSEAEEKHGHCDVETWRRLSWWRLLLVRRWW